MEKSMLKPRRLVLVPATVQGHINPMLRLGTILHSKGFSVTIVIPQVSYPNPPNQVSYPNPADHPHLIFIPLLSQDGMEIKSDDYAFDVMNINVNFKASLYEVLKKIIEEEKQNEEGLLPCVIHDGFMYFAQEIASSLKLPSIVLRIGSALNWIAYMWSYDHRHLLHKDLNLLELVPSLEPLRFKDLVVREYNETLLQLTEKVQKAAFSSSGVIWDSIEFLEQPSLVQHNHQFHRPNFFIGPMNKMAPNSYRRILEEDHSCITWLDLQAKNSVLYVSLGSLALIDKNDLMELAWGLANSQQPFLWVLRPDSLFDGSNPNDVIGDDFINSIRQRGCIVNWVSQERVLQHSAIGGFLTHCGWNSIIESISEGVPMICRPFMFDHWSNSRYVSYIWRVGNELENGYERREIEKAVKRLMDENEGKEIRERVANLKVKLQLCVEKGGSSYDSVNKLVDFIMQI